MDVEIEKSETSGFIIFAIGLIIMTYGFFALYGILDTWLHLDTIVSLIPTISEIPSDRSDLLRLMIYTCLGSMLGASMISLKGLHRYASITKTFNIAYTGSYILGPLAALLLGFIVFILMNAGLLFFSANEQISSITPKVEFSFILLGILAGFGWDSVLSKIEEIVSSVFSPKRLPLRQKYSSQNPSNAYPPIPSNSEQRDSE